MTTYIQNPDDAADVRSVTLSADITVGDFADDDGNPVTLVATCPNLALIGWKVIDELPKPPVTAEDVQIERNRRLAGGFDYDFGTPEAPNVHRIATTEADMIGWDEVTKGAQAAINLGAPDTELNIVTETGPVTVTAMQWQRVLAAATAFRQPIWAASFALQAMDPIPQDYADDSRWTA